MGRDSKMRRFMRGRVFYSVVSPVLMLYSAASLAAVPVCGDLDPVLQIMSTNGASNEVLWVRTDENPANVCLTSDAVQERAQLGDLDFHVCEREVSGETVKSFGIATTDVNRGEVLWYPQGVGPPSVISPNASCTDCPAKANHATVSSDGYLFVADTGGAIPRIGRFAPKAANACDDPYMDPVFSGEVKAKPARGGPQSFGEILDMAASTQLGGPVEVNSIVILTGSPSMLAILTDADELENFAAGDGLTAEILLDPSFFGDKIPKTITIVPGSAGVGNNAVSFSPYILLGLNDPDQVLKVRFDSNGNYTNSELLGSGAGISPDRLDAGVLEGKNLLMIGTGNGQIHQFTLDPDDDWNIDDTVPQISITDNVQKVGGVSIFDDAVVAELCVDDGSVNTDTGCKIGNIAQVHLSQLLCPPSNPSCTTGILETDTLTVDYEIIEDTGRVNGLLTLEDDAGNPIGYVPESCEGFALPDDPQGRKVMIRVSFDASFKVLPGNIMEVTKEIADILPEIPTCPNSFARLYYLEDPEDRGGYPAVYQNSDVLRNLTFSCTNPGRMVGPGASTFAYCADTYKKIIQDRGGRRLNGPARRAVESEIGARLDRIQAFVDLLPDSLLDGSDLSYSPSAPLNANLSALIEAARATASGGNADFAAAAGFLDLGAVLVYENKAALTSLGLGSFEPDNIYGVLLSEQLAVAFFLAQSLTYQGAYCPPALLITPVLGDATTPELRDIACTTPPPPLPAFP